jgi:hypothetical protein
MDNTDLPKAAQDELALAAEWRNRYIPDESNPLYEAWSTANLLEILLGKTLPISVQIAMARASRILFQLLAERNLP